MPKSPRKFYPAILLNLLLLANFLLAGCVPLNEAPPTPIPLIPEGFKGAILVGGIFDLTGETSGEGKDYAAGARAFTALYNSKGGAGGYKIDLKATDYESKARRRRRNFATFEGF